MFLHSDLQPTEYPQNNPPETPRRATAPPPVHDTTTEELTSRIGLSQVRSNSFCGGLASRHPIENNASILTDDDVTNFSIATINQIRSENMTGSSQTVAAAQPASGYFARMSGSVGSLVKKWVYAGFDPRKIIAVCQTHLKEFSGDDQLAEAIKIGSFVLKNFLIQNSASFSNGSWKTSLVNWLVNGDPEEVQTIIEANLMQIALHLAKDTVAKGQAEAKGSAFAAAMLARLLQILDEMIPIIKQRMKHAEGCISASSKITEKEALFKLVANEYLHILFPNKVNDLLLPPVVHRFSSLWSTIEESFPRLLAWVYDEWISRQKETDKKADRLLQQPGAKELLDLFDKAASRGQSVLTEKLKGVKISRFLGKTISSYVFHSIDNQEVCDGLGCWIGGVIRHLASNKENLQPLWNGLIHAARSTLIHILSSATTVSTEKNIICDLTTSLLRTCWQGSALNSMPEQEDFDLLADSVLEVLGLSDEHLKQVLPFAGENIRPYIKQYAVKFFMEFYADVVVPMNREIAETEGLCGEKPLKNALEGLIRYLSPSIRGVIADSSEDLVHLAFEKAIVWLLPEKIGSLQEKIIGQGVCELIQDNSEETERLWTLLENNITRLFLHAFTNLAASFSLYPTLQEAQARRRALPTAAFHLLALLQKHSSELGTSDFNKRWMSRHLHSEETKRSTYNKSLQDCLVPLSKDICRSSGLDQEENWEVPSRFKKPMIDFFSGSIFPYLLLRLYGDLYQQPNRSEEEAQQLSLMDPEGLMPAFYHHSAAGILQNISQAIGLVPEGNSSPALDQFLHWVIELFSGICHPDGLSPSDQEWLVDDLRFALQKQSAITAYFHENLKGWIAGILQQTIEELALQYAKRHPGSGSLLKNAFWQLRDVLLGSDVETILGADLTDKILALENSSRGIGTETTDCPIHENAYSEILDRFRGFLRYLFASVGIKNAGDLKVPFFLQGAIWDLLLSDTGLPEFCFNLYRELWVRPKQEFWIPSAEDGLQSQLKLVRKLARTLSVYGAAACKNYLGKQNEFLADSLLSLCQDFGFMHIPKHSLEELFAELAADPSEANQCLWNSLQKLLEDRLYSFLCFAGFQQDRKNPIANILLTCFRISNEYFSAHEKEIQEELPAVLALQEPDKALAAQRLFGGLADRLLREFGIETLDPKSLNINGLANSYRLHLPFLHKPLLLLIKDKFLPQFFLTSYADIMLSTFQLDIDRARLKELLFQKASLSCPQLFVVSDSGLQPAAVKEQIWAFAGTTQVAEHVEAALSAISALISQSLHTLLTNKPEILARQLRVWFPSLMEAPGAMSYYRKAFLQALEGPYFQNTLEGMQQLLHSALLRLFVNTAETTERPLGDPEESPMKYLLGNLILRIANLLQRHQQALNEVYNTLGQADEESKLAEMQKACEPLAQEFFSIPGGNILEQMPLFSFLRPIVEHYLTNTLLPTFFAKSFIRSKEFDEQAAQAREHLNELHRSEEVTQAIHSIARFSDRLLTHKMTNERSLFVDPLFYAMREFLQAQPDITSGVVQYVEDNQEAVHKWIGDNTLEWIQAAQQPAVEMCQEYMQGWLEKALFKLIEGVSVHVNSFEDPQSQNYNRNSMENLAQKILQKAILHFETVQACTKKLNKKHAYTVPLVEKLKSFEESEHSPLHKGVPGSAAYANHTRICNQAKRIIKLQEKEAAKWRGKNPERVAAAEEIIAKQWEEIENSRIALEEIRRIGAYEPFVKKLLQMANIQGPEDLGLHAMPASLWRKFTEKMLPAIIRNLCGNLAQKDNINALLLNLVKAVNTRLSAIPSDAVPTAAPIPNEEQLTEEEILAEQIRQKELNEACGSALHTFISYLPESLTESLFAIGKLRKMANEQAGIVLRQALKDLKMSDIIGQLIKSAAANLPDGENLAMDETAEREYEQHRVKKAKEVEKAILDETVNTVNILKENFWDALDVKWQKFQSAFDKFVAAHFPKNGPRIKTVLDFYCRKIFINMLGSFIQMLLYVPYKIIWACIELHTAYQAEVVKRNVHDPINENLFYQFMEAVLDNYPTEPQTALA